MGKTILQYALGVTRETTEPTNDKSNPIRQYALGVMKTPDINFINNPANNQADIILTDSVLDSRLTYTGPRHAYIAQDGSIKFTAAANNWPVEYRGGVAMGRHLPEAAGTNLFPDVRYATIGTGWTKPAGASGNLVVLQPTAGIDGAQCVQVPSAWYKGAVYNGATAAFVIAETDAWVGSIGESGWNRIGLKPVFADVAAASRAYVGRQDASNYLWGTVNIPASGNYTFSQFRKNNAADSTYYLALPQFESGLISSSPIDPSIAGSTTRAASSVVLNFGNAKKITLTMSDDTTQVFNNPVAPFNLPVSALDWGTKFLKKISFS